MKKLFSIAALTLAFGSSLFAQQPDLRATLYGGGVNYSNSDLMNYKIITGVTINKKIGMVNNLMGDLKYVYFDSDIDRPHKWDLSLEYTINNLYPTYQFQVGGKLVDAYKFGHKTLYSGWVGVNEKKPSLLPDVRTGLKFYYSDLTKLWDKKIFQVDFTAMTKKKNIAGGVALFKNVLTYQKFNKDDFNGRDTYLSDTISAKLIKGRTIYMGHVTLGHSALKILQDSKYGMDTTSNVHKWGVGVGIGYKIPKNGVLIAKLSYDKLKTSFGDDNAAETKYIIGYSVKF